MDDTKLERQEGARSFNHFITAVNLAKPKVRLSWLWVPLVGIQAGLMLSFYTSFYIPVVVVALTVGGVVLQYVIRELKWSGYLRKRQRSIENLSRDRELYKQMLLDFDHAQYLWTHIGLGERYLFLRGHLPIEYRKVLSVNYRCKEQQQTSTGTIPEQLGFCAELVNGQKIILDDIPCPKERMATRQGLIFKNYARVSLKERVQSDAPYPDIIRRIMERRKEVDEGQLPGEKSIDVDLTY